MAKLNLWLTIVPASGKAPIGVSIPDTDDEAAEEHVLDALRAHRQSVGTKVRVHKEVGGPQELMGTWRLDAPGKVSRI